MSKKPSAFERERLLHINYVMNSLYDQLAEIYEDLIDQSNQDVIDKLSVLSRDLKRLSDNLRDDEVQRS